MAETIVDKLGEKKALLSIALATMIITAVGVFITVAIIIVAPIALSVGKKSAFPKQPYYSLWLVAVKQVILFLQTQIPLP